MSYKAFDVVTVPDFSLEEAKIFEARTLFFLASWIENAGEARNFPLHLACIGEPPDSVCWLAERSNALISVHKPLKISDHEFPGRRNFFNTIRGLEVQPRKDRVLLLDVDILFLSDISDLAKMGYCISASRGSKPRVPEMYWREVYTMLGMELPTERIASVRGELGLPPIEKEAYPGQNMEFKNMYPYYNGGVVFAPWDCGLKEIWLSHLQYIHNYFSFDKQDKIKISKAIIGSDQIGLATAIEYLKQQGVPFVLLPEIYNTRIVHLIYALGWDEVKLYHLTGMFKNINRDNRVLTRLRRHHAKKIFLSWLMNKNTFNLSTNIQSFFRTSKSSYKFYKLTKRLYKEHVSEAIKHSR
jgi:hypothetical protein